jgi:hypothetical protein
MLINGTDFSSNKSELTVKIGAYEVTGKDFISASDDVLNVRIPSGVEGLLNVSVTVDERVGLSSANQFILGSSIKLTEQATEFEFTSNDNEDIDFRVDVFNRRAVEKINFWTKGISESNSDWKSQDLTSMFSDDRIDFAMSDTEFPKDPVGLHFSMKSLIHRLKNTATP